MTLTTGQWLTLGECAVRGRELTLEHLATTASHPDPAGAARFWSSRKLGDEDFHGAWDEYTAAVAKRDALACGQLGWETEYPDLIPANCPNGSAQEEAVQSAAQDADELLAVLIHGPKWGTA
jgi:hypothetical protein